MNNKTHEPKTLIDAALETLSQALAAGRSDELVTFLATLARFPDYSFRNVMLIVQQRPDATHVAGFRAWKRVGRYVRKGEKGIVIVAPIPIPSRDDDDEPGLRFRAVHVFDVAQTDGEPLPTLSTTQGDPGAFTGRLQALIATKGIALEYADTLGTALGTSSGGRIRIVSGLSPAEEFEVLVHELAHELLHHTGSAVPSKVVRETEAEAVAFTVSTAIGLSAAQSAANYIHLHQGDAETLAASLQRIQKVAAEILAGITDAPQAVAAA